jgi:hypothetical protein
MAGGGDKWDRGAHLDHAHVFIDSAFAVEAVETVHGPAEAVKVEHVACIDCAEVWSDVLVFGAALVPRLAGAEGIVVGRLGQGLARPGRNAPWTLDDPTEADLAEAEAWLDKYATRLPSGTVVLDHKAISAGRTQPEQF